MTMAIMRDIDNMQDKYYVNSKGEKIKLSEMNTEHIINSLAKCQRDIFNCKNQKETSQIIDKMNDLKNEYYRRFNNFNEKLGDK